VTKKPVETTSSAATLSAARSFTRRTLLKSAALAGAATVGGPYLLRRAWAQSGELKIFAWSGYISDEMLADFKSKTGITATYTPYGDQGEALNQLRATGGAGFDLIQPTVDRVPEFVAQEVLQPLDENKINWDGCIESAVTGSETRGGVVDGRRYVAPSDWGTEALAFDSTVAPLEYGKASYGDLWNPDYAGQVTLRGHSGLVGIGLWLEAEGRLPHPMIDSFKSEEIMRANYDVILQTAIENKDKIGQFWANENEAQAAFRTNGCVIGQTWDGTAATLRKEGLPIRYLAPKEGALTWLEGFSITKGAENVEAAYAWINWYYTPEAGAMYTRHSGYNTTAKGAEEFLPEDAKTFFAEAYPGDALDKLWWWPVQESWFVSARNEYQDRFLSA
jgi:spermidine/putrescine transport system substrate-binding protein